MNRLSSPIGNIKSHYDVVVVGSGYGGAIAASRLSRAGKRVCVLERGKERQPGEYPATTFEGAEELQLDLPDCHEGSRTGMFDIHVNRDISVLVGCGLGGTSLINANVSFLPDMRVFDDPRWPSAFRAEAGQRLVAGFELATKMLGANPYPANLPQPTKLVALQKSAEAMGRKFYRLPLNVTFEAGHNFAGVYQNACHLCGDCVSGCNHGAKNTVLMNYLPDAKRHGAEIYVEAAVRWVEKDPSGKWLVRYQLLQTGREAFDAPTLFITADIVILAAGSLGSTELLLRSRDAGHLALSSRLGDGFSGNGDVLGFGYNGSSEIGSVGLGQNGPKDGCDPTPEQVVGPCITGVIDMRGNPDLSDDMVMEDGAIPGLMAPLLAAVQKAASIAGGVNTHPDGLTDQQTREIQGAILGAYHGAPRYTQTYLGMCHDGSNGVMHLDGDRLRISWPAIGSRTVIATLNERLLEATRALQGIYLANPLWSDRLGKSLMTVHPLGGCNMADSAELGVVDHRGKVFSGGTGTAVHEGLYVCDGAIVPASVGVNPLLTISGLAERCCAILAEERGWQIDYSDKGPIKEPAVKRTVGVRFSETMKGWFSAADDDDFEAAARRGKEHGASFRFTIAIAADDVDATVAGSDHQARLVGLVDAPTLSPSPIAVTQGIFNLFVEEGAEGIRQMKYRMLLSTREGKSYHLRGFKIIRKGPIWKLWHDNTTLYTTIYEGPSDSGRVVGKGVLEIGAQEFIQLLATIDITNAANAKERMEASIKFGRFFAGTLYDKYGGITVPPRFGLPADGILSFGDSEEEVAPRKRRPLRASAPEHFPVETADGVEILLTRYPGGKRGPVILAHDIGSSSRLFALDTVGTNLLEYLFAEGYDVWLLDDRSSTELEVTGASVTAADVAEKDWPAVVARVRGVTDAASVQVVADGFRGTHFPRAMRSGLVGVRSAVLSQAAPPLQRMTIPTLFLHGTLTDSPLPAGTETAVEILAPDDGEGLSTRKVIAGYGDDDCMTGTNAAIEVYPHVLAHLAAT